MLGKSSAPGRTGWFMLLVVLLTVTVYFPGLVGDYVFDDMANLVKNDRLNIETLDYDSLRSATLSSGSGPLRRPVSMLTFALNRYFFGIHPYSHKVVNLVIHVFTGLALYLLARLLVTAWQRRTHALTENAVRWLPVMVASLWLVHPLNLSGVLYIVQRMTTLSALFTVCALCAYTAGRLRMLDGKSGKLIVLAGFFGFGGLALFSKETGALLPLFMLAIEVALFRFRNRKGRIDRFISGVFIVVLGIPACFALLWISTNPEWILGGYASRNFTLGERLLTEARVLMIYLKLIIMPTTGTLGLYQDDIALSRGLFSPPTTLYALLALAGLFSAGLVLLKRQPLVGLGILWFFCAHAMESTFIALEIAHEHRNYLADFGIILAIGSAITMIPLKKLGTVIRVFAPALFLCMLSYTTWLRAHQWSDNINFAVYEAMHHPKSFRAVYGAGRIHARLALNGRQESIEEAFSYLDRAREIDVSEIMPAAVMIKLSYLLDRPVQQEWYAEMLERLKNYPITPSALESLFELAGCMNGKCTFDPEIMEEMMQAALSNPNLPETGRMRAKAETIYGYFSINVRENFELGREMFYYAVKSNPREAQYWKNLINVLMVMNDFDAAEQALQRFRQADTHSGTEKDYRILMEDIENGRKFIQTPELTENPGAQ